MGGAGAFPSWARLGSAPQERGPARRFGNPIVPRPRGLVFPSSGAARPRNAVRPSGGGRPGGLRRGPLRPPGPGLARRSLPAKIHGVAMSRRPEPATAITTAQRAATHEALYPRLAALSADLSAMAHKRWSGSRPSKPGMRPSTRRSIALPGACRAASSCRCGGCGRRPSPSTMRPSASTARRCATSSPS